LSVAAQSGDPSSTLSLYRTALRLRREHLGPEGLVWHSAPGADVLIFDRPLASGALRCAINQGTANVSIVDSSPLVASGPMGPGGELPPDTAAWWFV
jgi:alpha-glucosidase